MGQLAEENLIGADWGVEGLLAALHVCNCVCTYTQCLVQSALPRCCGLPTGSSPDPPCVPTRLPAAWTQAKDAAPQEVLDQLLACPHVPGPPSGTRALRGEVVVPFLGDGVTGDTAASQQIAERGQGCCGSWQSRRHGLLWRRCLHWHCCQPVLVPGESSKLQVYFWAGH